MQRAIITLMGVVLALSSWASPARGASAEVEELKAQVRLLQQRIDQMEQREKERATTEARPAVVPPAAVTTAAEPPASGEKGEVVSRGTLRNEQEAAPRPDDLLLDPQFRGFTRIPNTKVLVKFNAKPRTDVTLDTWNAGDDNRFVTAKIPVFGQADHGGDPRFNINAKGSQLRIDVRAPEIAGKPRFYYENDFYGSGGGEFPYRLRHLYGQYYNIVVGQTYSIFEDPDVWPDNVDYEGPNSAIFARRPLVRYLLPFNKEWQMNFGIEQPEAEIDLTSQDGARSYNNAPDGGVNVRWEQADVGHVQLATILRSLSAEDTTEGKQSVLGWGFNLATVLNTWGPDSFQGQATYGHGLFRYSNDDFVNNDAAFQKDGDLQAIPYLGLMTGYTHHWSDQFRSTASGGYVHLDNTGAQTGDAYHETVYGSLNLIYQYHKRLSIGVEGLYGRRETKDGADGEVYRVTAVVYTIFD
jgi:DcaP outer membrane protein